MAGSKTFNVFRSTFAGTLNNLSLLLLNLLSRRLFLQYIGLEYLSIAQIISNLLVVLSFTELGLSNAVLYMLYKPMANKEYETVRIIISLYRKFNKCVGLVIGIIGMLAMPFLKIFIKTSIPLQTVYVIYLLNLLLSVSSYFYTYRNVLLSASQKDYIVSLTSMAVSFLRICSQCAVIYLTHDYLLYLITGIIASVIQNAVVYFFASRTFPYIRDLHITADPAEKKAHKKDLLKNVRSMASIKITAIVINNTDNILVSWLNTIMVGVCSNYTAISTQLKSLISIFHHSLLHSIGVASTERTNAEKYVLFQKVLLVNTFITGLAAICLGVLWDDFIVMWIGDSYKIDTVVYYSLLLNFTWDIMISPIWMFRDANGMFVYVKWMLLFNSFLNIVISIILGKTWGVGGVYIATIISDVLTDFWYDSNIIFRKVFNKNHAFSYQFHIIENVSVVLMGVVLISELTATWPVTIPIWLAKGVLTAFAYTMWFIVRYRKKEAFQKIVRTNIMPIITKIKK